MKLKKQTNKEVDVQTKGKRKKPAFKYAGI